MQPKISRIYWISGWLFDFTKIISIMFVYGLIIHFFILTLNIVQGESMVPTFNDKDLVFVDRLTYRLRPPARGEIVSFNFPGAENKKFIKRIIAVPGDEIHIEDGKVFINGQILVEDYILAEVKTTPELRYVLDKDEYYVLGDARNNSLDSRHWGGLPKSYMIGRVIDLPSGIISSIQQSVRGAIQTFWTRYRPS